MIGALSPGKRIIKKKQYQKLYEGHIERIKQYRPNTTGWQWEYDPPTLSKKKKQMMDLDKLAEIQRQNQSLLQKIGVNSIIKRPSIDADTEGMSRSLNSSFRKRQLQSIDSQNLKLLKRLHEKKSQYSRNKLMQEWKKQKQVIKNIAAFPFIIRDGSRRYKKKAVSKNDPSSKDMNFSDRTSLSGDIQMVRLRTINGLNLIITLTLNKEVLRIVGEQKKAQIVKIIQIPRVQAIQFIELECNGKIENIFDLIYFDNEKNILYLISRQQIEIYKQQFDKIGPLLDIS